VQSFHSASARFFAGSWSATQSGASSVGPSKNVGGKAPPCLSLKARRGARALAGHSHIGPVGRISVLSYLSAGPGIRCPWDRTPLGVETAAPYQPRAALAAEGSEIRRNLLNLRFRRCTGRLNATQPGVLAVSPLYIRGLGIACKRSVAGSQQSTLFAKSALRFS
jgi:hypothetical protein